MQSDLLSAEDLLRLTKTQVFHGPNPWAMDPVVLCELEVTAQSLPSPENWASLKNLCPAWALDEAVTRVEPAEDDVALTLARRIVDWSLAALNEVRGCVRAGGVRRLGTGRILIWVGFHQPQVTLRAMRLASAALSLACSGEAPFPRERIAAELEKLWPACRRWHPDYQARILMRAAGALNLPVLPFGKGDNRLWQFGWGSRSRVFFESQSNEDGVLGHQLSRFKSSAKELLSTLGFPTAAQVLVSEAAELPQAAAAIGWPCVAKPLDRGGGRGVTAGILNPADLETAFVHARRFTQGPVMVEALVEGDDHRLMVVDGSLVAAIRRDPPSVVGDGERSVRMLIENLNRERGPNLAASRYLRPVAVDEVVLASLRQQALDPDDVPAPGRQVRLRSNANLSTGGSCTDVTDRIHPDIRRMAESIALSLGLATCGVDYITTDISRPWRDTGGALIEVNTTPGMDAAIAAGADEVQVGIQMLGEVPGRLPVTLLLAPKELQQAWLPGLQAEAARRAGLAWLCAGESGIGAMPLSLRGRPLHECVASLLRNRLTEALFVVCTAAELQKAGLPVDRVDRALLCRQELPASWQGVLDAAAANVQRVDEAAAVREACLVALAPASVEAAQTG